MYLAQLHNIFVLKHDFYFYKVKVAYLLIGIILLNGADSFPMPALPYSFHFSSHCSHQQTKTSFTIFIFLHSDFFNIPDFFVESFHCWCRTLPDSSAMHRPPLAAEIAAIYQGVFLILHIPIPTSRNITYIWTPIVTLTSYFLETYMYKYHYGNYLKQIKVNYRKKCTFKKTPQYCSVLQCCPIWTPVMPSAVVTIRMQGR